MVLALGVFSFSGRKVPVDPRLKPYVIEWCWAMEQAGLPWKERLGRLKSVVVEYYSVDSRETGNYWHGSRQVTINGHFLKRNPCAVRATVFHELGHACFGLEHGSCTIMRAQTIVDEQVYCDRWDLMVKEYLVQCKKAER